MIQNIRLLKKETITNEIMAFYWEKPADFKYIAGQNGNFTLINPSETDEKGNIRTFSFVGTPYEKNLIIATRMRNTAFKRNLKSMPIGTKIKLDGPYGDFKLHKNYLKPAVFLIGGIGITPVLSIIATAIHDKQPHIITLLFSNKTPEDAPFIQKLDKLANENSNFTFIPVYTKTFDSKEGSEQGHIDANMLNKYIPNIAEPIYYLSGPPEMVKSIRQLLIDIGADEDNLRAEEFSGY